MINGRTDGRTDTRRQRRVIIKLNKDFRKEISLDNCNIVLPISHMHTQQSHKCNSIITDLSSAAEVMS